jgi:hypothetical protein
VRRFDSCRGYHATTPVVQGTSLGLVNHQGHYLDGLWFATAALVPIAGIRIRWQGCIVVAGVTALAFVSAAGVALRGSCYNDDLCISASDLADLPNREQVRTIGLLQVYVYPRDVFADLPVAANHRPASVEDQGQSGVPRS